jgi:hypothetical protein
MTAAWVLRMAGADDESLLDEEKPWFSSHLARDVGTEAPRLV